MLRFRIYDRDYLTKDGFWATEAEKRITEDVKRAKEEGFRCSECGKCITEHVKGSKEEGFFIPNGVIPVAERSNCIAKAVDPAAKYEC